MARNGHDSGRGDRARELDRSDERGRATGFDPERERGRHGATAHGGAHRGGGGHNVNGVERLLSLAAGGTLAYYASRRRNIGGLGMGVLGGILIERGVTGQCAVYDALGVTSAGEGGRRVALPHRDEGVIRQHGGAATVDSRTAAKVERSITIFGRTPDELFAYWRELENLPRIFKHLESVREVDDRRSHWVAKGPAGTTVEWDAEIINEIPGQLIAWKSLPGARVPNAGAVRFRRAAADRGTQLEVTLEYQPPAGALGKFVARLFGEEPELQVREDLRRYKALMEAGELPVSENPGQGARARTTFDAQVNQGRTGGDIRELQQEAPGQAHEPKHQPMPGDVGRVAQVRNTSTSEARA